MKDRSHPYVQLARDTIRHYLDRGEPPPLPRELPDIFQRRAGCFVTLKREGQLRGCIGTLTPQTETLAEEIARNALRAAFNDPRFPPLEAGIFHELHVAVEVVSPPVPVKDLRSLDPRRYGLVVRCENRQGVLLPGIEGVETVEDQLRICLEKGRIDPEEAKEFYCFEVESYH